jgi:hemerythrin-like domain-containing protein
MMNLSRQTSLALHQDHRANLQLLARSEQAFARASRTAPGADPEFLKLIAALAKHLQQDVDRHFGFEERELFSRLREAGDGGIAMLLGSEHEAIRAVAEELLPLASSAASGTLDAAGWATLKDCVMELVERQVSHIQKEEMALLPMLNDLLDDETDRRLASEYAASGLN